MKLYCVFRTEEIIGRFRTKEKAMNYAMDCWFDGYENIKVKTLTETEYLNYTKKLIDKSKKI